MKVFLAVATAAGLLACSALAQQPSDRKVAQAPGGELKDLRQKASYGYGYSLGRSLKAQSIDLDPDLSPEDLPTPSAAARRR